VYRDLRHPTDGRHQPALRHQHRAQPGQVARKAIDLRGESEYVSRQEIVLPKSRVYVQEDETYSVNVSAEDARNHTDSVDRTGIQVPRPSAA